MKKTIIQFDIIRAGKFLVADPRTLYVFGFINFNLLDELMEGGYSCLDVEMMPNETKRITLKVWEIQGDSGTELAYELLPDDYKITIPVFDN